MDIIYILRDRDGQVEEAFVDEGMANAEAQRINQLVEDSAASRGWHINGGYYVTPLGVTPAVAVVCGDYPAPCNCDDPVLHGGH